MGRPTKLTPEVQDAIVLAVSLANPLSNAARMSGIDRSTLFRAMQNDAAFRDRVTRARAEAVNSCVQVVRSAALDTTNPRHADHAQWYLERTEPDEFGRKNALRIETNREVRALLEAVREHMSQGAYAELVRAVGMVAGMGGEDVEDAAPAADGGATEH